MIDVGIIKISLLMAFKIPNYVRDVQILFQFKELTKILFIYKKPKEELYFLKNVLVIVKVNLEKTIVNFKFLIKSIFPVI